MLVVLKCLQNKRQKLTFLTAEKRIEQKQRIISEKQVYAQEFKLHFSNSYQAYLDDYPEKKNQIIFSVGLHMNCFIM